MKYIGDNADLLMKESKVLLPLAKLQKVFPVIIVLLFLIGAYITYNTPSKATLPEGFINIEPDAHVAQKLRNTNAVLVRRFHHQKNQINQTDFRLFF